MVALAPTSPRAPYVQHVPCPPGGGASAAQCPGSAAQAVPLGEAAPPLYLDKRTLNGYEPQKNPETPANTGFRIGEQGPRLLKDWAFPSEWTGPREGEPAVVLKIQSFQQGGYEATVRTLDLERIGRAMEFGGKPGKREVPQERSWDSIIKAAGRAKRQLRHLVKNMAADRMVTLTRREGPNTGGWTNEDWQRWNDGGSEAWQQQYGAFWNPEDWARAWDRFRRGMVRAFGEFPYVAVLEQHKKGNYHLHVALAGFLNLNAGNRIWWAICGGRGQGSLNLPKGLKRPMASRAERSSRIAGYISKYVTKGFGQSDRFNKKRYWASRQTLEEVRRYVLRSRTVQEGLEEVRAMLGLDWSDFFTLGQGLAPKAEDMFFFPDGSGAWINFLPGKHSVAGPPF